MSNKHDSWIPVQTALGLTPDGIAGRKTLHAVARALDSQGSWQAVQRAVGVAVDGMPGPLTAAAVSRALGGGKTAPAQSNLRQREAWPLQKDVERFYGEPGTDLVPVPLPYVMRLAWDVNTTVKSMTMHRKTAEATRRIFDKVLAHYGESRIQDLGLDLHGGSYNRRRMVGGSSWSMHAYGVAIDIDPEHNQLKWRRDKARLARPEYMAFWEIVESEGAVSLGRERDYDWMHFQFARL